MTGRTSPKSKQKQPAKIRDAKMLPLSTFFRNHVTHETIYNWMLELTASPDDMLINGYPTVRRNNNGVFVYKYPKASGEAQVIDFVKLVDDINQTQPEELIVQDNFTRTFTKTCDRCKIKFQVSSYGNYVSFEECHYHYGRVQNLNTSNGGTYDCCSQGPGSPGCVKHTGHVWSTSLKDGLNGPLYGYVKSKCSTEDIPYLNRMLGLDCEMCYTSNGMEVTRVTFVTIDGNVVYDSFVKPYGKIIDFNTRFSGITLEDMQNATKTLDVVQQEVLRLVDQNTVLIGHSLEHDLRVLRLVHPKAVDTSLLFKQKKGFPFKRALRTTYYSIFKTNIQTGGAEGHDSYEDACACIELVLYQISQNKSLNPV